MERAREIMEDLEAGLWKDAYLSRTRDETIIRYHCFVLHQLLAMRIDSELKSCDFCGKPSTNVCSGCKEAFYCNRQCQKDHRAQHKNECKLQENLETSETIGANNMQNAEDRPFAVLVLYKGLCYTFFMTKEELQDYTLFIGVVRSLIPRFHKTRDFAWKKWKSVRDMALVTHT
jgi:hypothetical protein